MLQGLIFFAILPQKSPDSVVLLVTYVALLAAFQQARRAFLPLACDKKGRGRGSEVRGCGIHVPRRAFLPLENTQLLLDNGNLPLEEHNLIRGCHNLPRGCRNLLLIDGFQVHGRHGLRADPTQLPRGCRNHVHGCPKLPLARGAVVPMCRYLIHGYPSLPLENGRKARGCGDQGHGCRVEVRGSRKLVRGQRLVVLRSRRFIRFWQDGCWQLSGHTAVFCRL